MERLYTHIIGTPVVEDDLPRPITTVKDLVIDPENGKLLALYVSNLKNTVIVPSDIVFWGDRVQINDQEALVPASEVLRVENVLKRRIKIFGNRVEAEDGTYLGKVIDFSLDSQNWGLQRLFVAKEVLGLVRYQARILSAKDIVEILPNKIVVKANMQNVKEVVETAKMEDLAIS